MRGPLSEGGTLVVTAAALGSSSCTGALRGYVGQVNLEAIPQLEVRLVRPPGNPQ